LPLKLKNYANHNIEAQKMYQIYNTLFFDILHEKDVMDKTIKTSLKEIERILFS